MYPRFVTSPILLEHIYGVGSVILHGILTQVRTSHTKGAMVQNKAFQKDIESHV